MMHFGKRILVLTASLTPSAVATVTTAEQTFTVPGLHVGDYVLVIPPARTVNASMTYAYVSARDTLAICFVNPTAGSVTPTAGTYTILVFR